MSNIQNNRLNLTLTPVQQTDAQQHFADLRALFPFFIGLTSSEKKSEVLPFRWTVIGVLLMVVVV
jgi:hypothetical protein